jgi:hypothetical protein
MENNFQNEDRYFKASKRVEKVKAFYTHLIIYFSIIPVIVFINLKYTPEEHWFWYALVGGGIPVLIHAMKVYVFNTNWEEQKTKEILKQEENKQVWK